jgi:hypothetical protein
VGLAVCDERLAVGFSAATFIMVFSLHSFKDLQDKDVSS